MTDYESVGWRFESPWAHLLFVLVTISNLIIHANLVPSSFSFEKLQYAWNMGRKGHDLGTKYCLEGKLQFGS